MSYRGRGVSPSLGPSEAQFSPISAIHSQTASRSPEVRGVRKGNALHSKSSRRYPVETGDRAQRSGEDAILAPRGSVQAVRNESPINVRTFKLVAKPVSPERCKHCRSVHCTCKPVSQDPPKRLFSSKAPRTSNPTPMRSSKQSDSRLRQTPDQVPESDLEASCDVLSSPDSSYDIDTSAIVTLQDSGSPERDIGKHVQLPSISQSTRLEAARRPRLQKSVFVGRPATVFFDYPPQCLQPPRTPDRVLDMPDEEFDRCPLTFKVSDSVHTYNCFVNAYAYNGFTQTTSSSFNMLMSSPPKPEYLTSFNGYQRMNHFPGAWQFGRKDNLWRNVGRMRRKFGREYEICPMTFILPEDFKRFECEREEDPKAYWIRKPVASSCGRGIKVISGTTPVKKKHGYLYSKYIAHPHTINGLKYDLRVYVCVTCFDPLRIYIFEEGLVRFATEAYKLDKKTIKKRYTHLTNYSVNKAAAQYKPNTDPNADGVGSKWSFTALRKHYATLGIDSSALFSRIHDVIIKACIAVEPHIVNHMNRGTRYKTACFEVYGFDILIDSDLRPWLLEVNVCPSLSSSSPLDKRIKTTLMCDIFNLIGVVPFDRKQANRDFDSAEKKRLLTGAEKSGRPKYRGVAPLLACRDLTEYTLTEDDWKVLAETEEELTRLGHFERIFPLKGNTDCFEQFFEAPRYNNLLVWKYLKSDSAFVRRHFKLEGDAM